MGEIEFQVKQLKITLDNGKDFIIYMDNINKFYNARQQLIDNQDLVKLHYENKYGIDSSWSAESLSRHVWAFKINRKFPFELSLLNTAAITIPKDYIEYYNNIFTIQLKDTNYTNNFNLIDFCNLMNMTCEPYKVYNGKMYKNGKVSMLLHNNDNITIILEDN